MYEMSAKERHLVGLVERVKRYDLDLALEVDEAVTGLMCEVEDAAVRRHGQVVLAAIDGTSWLSSRDESMPGNSPLARIVDRA
jgi:hypothetical protein